MDHIYTLPRLYVKGPIAVAGTVTLDADAAHYLKNVLRVNAGASLRVFDGVSGEFHATITAIDKKSAALQIERQLRPQSSTTTAVHLLFPPLKKEALDFLIEKSTELGVTQFHPILTAQSDVRAINAERLTAQIIGATEQCERLTIPTLHELQPLEETLSAWDASIPIYAAIERDPETKSLTSMTSPTHAYAILIGPAGGWRAEEKTLLKRLPFMHAVHLGDNILRAETAALAMLAALKFS